MYYFDVHCHVLSKVDDGARDLDTSVAMIGKAYSEGIRAMILTPHYHGGHVETNINIINKEYNRLRGYVKKAYPDMKLFIGNEIYYYPSVPEWIDEGRVHTLADSNYVLLEFSNGVETRELMDAVQNMCANGYYPILAHVERYDKLVKTPSFVEDLIESGAHIQINAKAVMGQEGLKPKHFVKKLLKNNWVHFVGTDAHSMGSRQPEIAECAEYIINKFGSDYAASILYKNALCIVKNIPL